MKKNYSFRDASVGFAGVFLVSVGVLLVIGALMYLLTQNYGYTTTELTGNAWLNYLNSFLIETGFLLFVLIYSKKQKIDIFHATRLKVKFDKKVFWIVLLLTFVVFFGSINFVAMFSTFASTFAPKVSSSVPVDNIWQLLGTIFFFAVVPAVCEELLFRGIIYNGLRRSLSAVVSIIVSALVFTVIHFSIYQTVYQLILGLVLGCLVYFTGSIVYGMIFHFVNNLLVLLLTYFSSVGNFVVFSSFGWLEILISFAIFAVAVVATVYIFKFLNSYTEKHKKYFDLEQTKQPILSTDKNENAEAVRTRTGDTVLFVLIAVACVLLWLFNSFGG
jgi:membrane protease YdiL (CAAX protease family)